MPTQTGIVFDVVDVSNAVQIKIVRGQLVHYLRVMDRLGLDVLVLYSPRESNRIMAACVPLS